MLPFIASALLLAQPAQADNHVTATLICETKAVAPGQTAWLAVDYKIQPGWHMYWNGVNDTGYPPKIELTAPQGFRVGDSVWPAPKRLLAPGNELDFIYESHVALLIPVEVPKDASPGSTATFNASCEWLVCSSLCLPESSKVSLSLPVAKDAPKSAQAPIFDETRKRIPKPLPKDSPTKATIQGETLVIESPAATKLSFFPAEGCATMPKLAKEGQAAAQKLAIHFEPSPRVKGVIEVTTKDEKEPAYFSVDLETPAQKK